MNRRPFLRYKSYWIIMALWIVGWTGVGWAAGGSFGVNPYIAGALTGGGWALWETYRVARHGH